MKTESKKFKYFVLPTSLLEQSSNRYEPAAAEYKVKVGLLWVPGGMRLIFLRKSVNKSAVTGYRDKSASTY